MIPKGMSFEDANIKLLEIKREVLAGITCHIPSNEEVKRLTSIEWYKLCGVEYIEKGPSDLPEMVPEVPQLKSALPGGMPGPVMVTPTGERTPVPARVDDPAVANVGKGSWAEHKVPDVDPMADVTDPVPAPPAKAVRTPP